MDDADFILRRMDQLGEQVKSGDPEEAVAAAKAIAQLSEYIVERMLADEEPENR